MSHDPLCNEDSRDLGFVVTHKDGSQTKGDLYCDCELIERARKDERDKMQAYLEKVAAASYQAGLDAE